MSEMVERVRQALRTAGLDNPVWEEESLARAAIEAMREPTQAMVQAAYESYMDGLAEDATLKSNISAALTASVDAALSP